MSTTTGFSAARRWTHRLWSGVDAARRGLLNLLFLAVVAGLLWALLRGIGGSAPLLAEKTALVLTLRGPLVEQRAGGVRDNALAKVRGETTQSTRLRDVLDGLAAAASDPKISSLLLLPDDLQAAGLPALREVAAAVERFKAAGKPVVAWGSGYDQRQFYLAAHASEVLMHPFGVVFLEGYGRRRNYYRDVLDRLGVDVNLVRVGTYKSAAEPFIANGPSDAATKADAFLYGGLWSTWLEGVERARKLPAGSVMRGIDESPQRLLAAGGDAARLALDAKLVDALATPDELRRSMITRGAEDTERKTFRQVPFDDYLSSVKPKLTGDAVGVVVAEGEIVDGSALPGTVGGKSTAELIRKARDDDAIKAVVLRVNSPGGSVFGSELVRRELELTRAAGKPVVVSMGNLAASGGYWISTASDEIIADPATVTGSIGVFALLPNGAKALDKLGVHPAGVTTTWLGGAGDPRLAPDPRFLALVQASVDHVYLDFTSRVATARKTTPQKIDEVAQGRVWTGAQARERGLVDRLGGFGDALASAAQRAKLAAGYRVTYVEASGGRIERLLDMLGARIVHAVVEQLVGSGGAATAAAEAGAGWPATSAPLTLTSLAPLAAPLAADVQRDFGWLAGLRGGSASGSAGLDGASTGGKPFIALAHCLCRP